MPLIWNRSLDFTSQINDKPHYLGCAPPGRQVQAHPGDYFYDYECIHLDGVTQVKQCPICGSKFSGAEAFCPHDGARLLEAEQPAQLLGKMLHDTVKLENLLYKDAFGERYSGRLNSGESVKVTVFNQAFVPDETRVASLVTTKTLLDEPLPKAIAPTHSWDLQSTPAYLIEGLPSGPSLQVLMSERGTLDWRTAIKLTCATARALEWMDGQGVLHRCVQPDSISVTHIKKGSVHLGEWALGVLAHKEAPLEAIELGNLISAAPYMAPEVIEGSPADRRSLIYSLGILLYEMLTGKNPYKTQQTADTLKRHLREKPVKLSISYEGEPLPPALDDLLDVMIAKQPEQRFQALGALVNALSSLLDDGTSAQDFPEPERDSSNTSVTVSAAAAEDVKKDDEPPKQTTRDSGGNKTLLFISAEDVKKAREADLASKAAEEDKSSTPEEEPKKEEPKEDAATQDSTPEAAPVEEVEDSEKPTLQMDSSILDQDKKEEAEPVAVAAEPPLKKKKKKKKKSKDTIRLSANDLPDTSNQVSIDDPESEVTDDSDENASSTIVISKDFSDEVDNIASTSDENTGASSTSDTSKDDETSEAPAKIEIDSSLLEEPKKEESSKSSIIIEDTLKEEALALPSVEEDKEKEDASAPKEDDAQPSTPTSSAEPSEDEWFNSDSEKAWDNEIHMEHAERTDKKFKTYLIVALVIFVIAIIIGAIMIATTPEEEAEASLTQEQTPATMLATFTPSLSESLNTTT